MHTQEKRKNGTRRRLPLWIILLVIGFGLGVVATLTLVRPTSRTVYNPAPDDAFMLTATAVVESATQAANNRGTSDAPLSDPFLLTATAIVQSATQAAQTSDTAAFDAFSLTATHIVGQATAQAAGG
jgi:hypothetical protein